MVDVMLPGNVHCMTSVAVDLSVHWYLGGQQTLGRSAQSAVSRHFAVDGMRGGGRFTAFVPFAHAFCLFWIITCWKGEETLYIFKYYVALPPPLPPIHLHFFTTHEMPLMSNILISDVSKR